jgi:small subunit ribosomal protein S17
MVLLKKEVNKNSMGKEIIGEVLSDKMDKTIVIKVVRALRHTEFGKVVRLHKKFKVHDEKNMAKIGDLVSVKECRPISKEKHMTLVRILSKQ